VTAGEQLQITQEIADFFSRLPSCVLHNQYGPTESHVVTAFALDGAPGDWPALPPIGRPIANTQTYLLDQDFQPTPVGVAGELYIGGVSLARGYAARPDLTAERFIPDPFAQATGARMYRSGDIARYAEDGKIEFMGRADDQVKARGYRIELAEVEGALRTHPKVRQAAVALRSDGPADKWLAAYLVTDGEPFAPGELRQFLRERLPEHMIPSKFIRLEALPLTPSGKVNRLALPIHDLTREEQAVPYVAPRTPTEESMAAIWAEVLRLERVGVHDNFFELGGHSLLATKLVSRLRAAFNIELPLRHLFTTPTAAELAEIVDQMLIDKIGDDKLEELVAKLDRLSEDEAQMILAEESFNG
jgi:acyl carrier protein